MLHTRVPLAPAWKDRMTKRISLTVACGDYEIVRAIKEGTIRPDGIDLTVLTDMDSASRHWRFLRNGEFDMAELSCSSYLAAFDRGLPFRAIPVFLHRRFRHGFVFINTGKGIRGPKDLIGRRVGTKTFLTTATLWLRGILEHEYGVPHRSIHWFAELDEDVPFTPPADMKLTRLPDDKSVETMLAEGEIDALLHSDLIQPMLDGDPRVARLFPHYKDDERAYYQKTEIFPIMHVFGIRREIVEQHPWVPTNIFNAFEEAKRLGMQRMENPRVVPLAWYREAWEEQEALLGPDPWEYGLGPRNRHNLETLVGYSHEQGLIGRKIPVDELFLNVSAGRKRGKFRI
jgi:4,5-dihydroxyphthalate decarboxylase